MGPTERSSRTSSHSTDSGSWCRNGSTPVRRATSSFYTSSLELVKPLTATVSPEPSIDLDWTGWHPLDEDFRSNLPSKPGVYRIRLGEPVGRLLGTDDQGLLNIGKSEGSIAARMAKFRVSTQGKYRHASGNRFHLLGLEDQLGIDLADLEVSAAVVPKDQASQVERELHVRYQLEYGELPPLNNSGGVSPNRPPADRRDTRST